ncbi:MAG: proteasome subunit beta [Candidatus Micrarchaeota archaeon]
MTANTPELKTGTTTVGVIANDAVILAADMRASLGHIAYDEENDKLSEITKHIGLTNAGSVGDTMTIVRFLRSHTKMYELEREHEISPKALVTYLANVLSSRYWEVQYLVGGFGDKPQLFEVAPGGAILERNKYAVSGSGTEFALTTLDVGYKENLSREDAITLAIAAISSGKRRDIFSGGQSVSVMIIDQNGTARLPQKQVEKYLKTSKNI